MPACRRGRSRSRGRTSRACSRRAASAGWTSTRRSRSASSLAGVISLLAHHGVLAVFVLMAVDAVFPAASELVMVYGGALASGALAHQLHFAGSPVDSNLVAYLLIATAGTLGYLVGAIGGWAIGLYGGRPFLERHGRWFHLGHDRLERAERWFGRWGD